MKFARAPRMRTPFEDRRCEHCGRRFSWRKQWARDWDSRRHCSAACRRGHRRGPAYARALEEAALACLHEAPHRTGTVHEIATQLQQAQIRAVPAEVHHAIRRLMVRGKIVAGPRGRPASPDEIRRETLVRAAPT